MRFVFFLFFRSLFLSLSLLTFFRSLGCVGSTDSMFFFSNTHFTVSTSAMSKDHADADDDDDDDDEAVGEDFLDDRFLLFLLLLVLDDDVDGLEKRLS